MRDELSPEGLRSRTQHPYSIPSQSYNRNKACVKAKRLNRGELSVQTPVQRLDGNDQSKAQDITLLYISRWRLVFVHKNRRLPIARPVSADKVQHDNYSNSNEVNDGDQKEGELRPPR